MDTLLATRVATLRGAFTTRDARACGYDADDLRALVSRGEILRVAPRAYVDRARFDAAAPEARHALTARAVVRSFEGRVAASHHSALSLMQLPTWGVPLDVVHVVRTGDRLSRRRHGLSIRLGYGQGSLCRIGGTLSVLPALAVLGAAMVGGVEAGVVAADAALAAGRTTEAELRSWADRLAHSPALRTARRAVELADARAESVGESRARLLLRALGFTAVEPQARICDGPTIVARVDYLVAGCVVVEFDGRVKYEGVGGAEALFREKQREDRLLDLGYEVVRLTWADLSRPQAVDTRLRAALARAARRA